MTDVKSDDADVDDQADEDEPAVGDDDQQQRRQSDRVCAGPTVALPGRDRRDRPVRDQELDAAVAAGQLGEPWALRVIYDELAPRVRGYLRSRGADDPDDLTSEVFLAVFPRLGSVTGGGAGVRTLVFSVAHARLVDDLRRRSRRQPTVEYDPGTDERSAPSSEDEALALLATDRVRELLAVLPGDQRDVLLLRVVSDLSVDQVAQAMNRSPGAVKQLQRRGLLALRAHAEEGRVTLWAR